MAKYETMKLSQLIKRLQTIKKEIGDKKVIMSKDCEGNSYGSIDKDSFGYYADTDLLVIFPMVDHLDPEDFIEDEEDE